MKALKLLLLSGFVSLALALDYNNNTKPGSIVNAGENGFIFTVDADIDSGEVAYSKVLNLSSMAWLDSTSDYVGTFKLNCNDRSDDAAVTDSAKATGVIQWSEYFSVDEKSGGSYADGWTDDGETIAIADASANGAVVEGTAIVVEAPGPTTRAARIKITSNATKPEDAVRCRGYLVRPKLK